MSRSARVLAPSDVRRLLAHVRSGSYANRNTVLVLLSFRAGLRACEMAGMTWEMVTRPDGKFSDTVEVGDHIAKNGRARRIPLHPELRSALVALRRIEGQRSGPVIRSQRGGHMTPRAVVNWFRAVYQDLGFAGCSSHSGRRTFITQSARLITKAGGSLRDVQELAGHRALTTTERYIEGDRDAQRRLVRLLL